jgi:hypothetical protein
MDLVTPPIEVSPGMAIGGSNYEPLARGYGRIQGIERLDGRPPPSEAAYWLLRFDTGGPDYVRAGDTVPGLVNGATGVALIDGVIESGAYAAGTAVGYLVLADVVGAFAGDGFEVAGTERRGVALGEAQERGWVGPEEDAAWTQLAIARARAKIAVVPGSGPVRGVWLFKGAALAVRDNTAGTAAVLHKATAAGWVAVGAGDEQVPFKTGTIEFTVGDTILGGTSGVTKTLNRVILVSGAWSTGDADGRLSLSAGSGGGQFIPNETLTGVTFPGAAVARNVSTPIVIPPGGRFMFVTTNFAGIQNAPSVYMANGVGRALEWNGVDLMVIDTGLNVSLDKPTHVAAHQNQLFLGFRGGSLLYSAIGNPYTWTVIEGAGEIALGEDITALLSLVKDTLLIGGKTRISLLYGTTVVGAQLSVLSDDSGAFPWTTERLNQAMYLDRGGVRALNAAQEFGDFTRGTLTAQIVPLIRRQLARGVAPVASMRVTAKEQYRLFWDNGTGLSIFLGRDASEVMTFDYSPIKTFTSCSGEDTAGREMLLIGAENGFVYQLDRGTSLDGAAIESFIRLPFNHVGQPSRNKRWQKVALELDVGASNIDLKVSSEVSYGDPQQPSGEEQTFLLNGGGAAWSEGFWNEFQWSSPIQGTGESWIDRIGKNLSLALYSESATDLSHVLHGVTLHYTLRNLAR